MKPTTLKEIAEKLGISIPTVSKALKNYPDVSEETKKLVLKTAEDLKYRPNSFAVNLRTKQSKTIGLIIPEIVHYFFSNAIKGIVNQAEKKGYLVIILQSNESYELEKQQIELLLNKNIDGLLISIANNTVNFDHLYKILDFDIPLVMFDRIAKLVDCSKVIIDDRKAAYTATQHLIDTGCKKIAHFRGPSLSQISIDRFLGYKKAIEDNNLTYDSSKVFTCDEMSFEQGVLFANKIVEDAIDVDGIFVSSDLVAIGAITEFKKHGVLIPSQISIVGFSNWFMSSAITPTLTTIDQPGYEMGKVAFKQLYKELNMKKNNKNIVPKTIELDTHLVVRNSTLNTHKY